MRRLTILLLSAVVLTLPGCVDYENGLCSPDEKEAVFDPALLGDWEDFSPEPGQERDGYYKIERDDPKSKAYRISWIRLPEDPKKVVRPSPLKAYLVRLGNATFLDVAFLGEKEECLRHYLFKIGVKQGEITTRMLNEDFAAAHASELPQSKGGFFLNKCITVLATPRELADFVAKHANNPAAWKASGDGRDGGKLRRRQ